MTLIPELISHPTISNRLLFPFSCSFICTLRQWNQFCWIFWFLAQRARMCARAFTSTHSVAALFQWHFSRSFIAFAIRQSRTLVFNGLRLLICIQSECRMLIFNGRHRHNIPEISHSVPSFYPNYTLLALALFHALSPLRHQHPFLIRLEFYTSIWFIFYSLDFNLWKSEIVIVVRRAPFFLRGDYRHQVHGKM